MANTNAFVTWATGVGANVLSAANYSAATIRQLGAQIGIGDPVTFNNAMRQASVVATMIAQFTADYGPSSVNDDGNVATLEAQFEAALQSIITAAVQSVTEGQNAFVHYANADTGTANNYVFASPAPAVTAYTAGLLLLAKAANANTGASTINVESLGILPLTRPDQTALKAGDIAAGDVMVLTCDGSRFQLESILPAAVVATATSVVTVSGAFTTPTGNTVKVGIQRQSFLGVSSTSLPASAVDGTMVSYTDLVGNFQAYPLTITPPSGQTIAGEPNWTCNIDRGSWSFTYYATANSWGVK